jgi:hypothetical protein
VSAEERADQMLYCSDPPYHPHVDGQASRAVRVELTVGEVLEAPRNTLIDLGDAARAESMLMAAPRTFGILNLPLPHFHSPAYQRHTRRR